jgi:hypothetical protein
MQFGLFGSAQADTNILGAGIGQGFHDYIDYNVGAEALGSVVPEQVKLSDDATLDVPLNLGRMRLEHFGG